MASNPLTRRACSHGVRFGTLREVAGIWWLLELGSDFESTGDTLGRYRILGELGRGGMGVVLLGEDPELQREVAIKVLPPHLSGNPLAYARFQREARLLAALSHPNIATIHSLEIVGSTPILTMERIRGETLAARLSRERTLSVEEGVRIGVSIARALEAAHDRSVIHRDLKPGNVMIREDGEIKVLDFGLATQVDTSAASKSGLVAVERAAGPLEPGTHSAPAAAHSASRAPVAVTNEKTGLAESKPDLDNILEADATLPDLSLSDPTSASDLSHSGGTPGYMSPEQILGHSLDERSDIFAFGCILYECCSVENRSQRGKRHRNGCRQRSNRPGAPAACLRISPTPFAR